mmetsp:Transcript_2262/g.6643  ORF Transcript_2262/g.6643 Transcript_2262/m.6643 type:complete len:222 (+) Transcript_2262:954-1619(+)
MLKHNTGAATLEIHMLLTVAMVIEARRTHDPFRPTCWSTIMARRLAMRCLERADAMVKPPSNSITVWLKITLKTLFIACCAGNGSPSGELTARRVTTKKGMAMEVTYSGMASVHHRMEAASRIARQLRWAGASGALPKRRERRTAAATATAARMQAALISSGGTAHFVLDAQGMIVVFPSLRSSSMRSFQIACLSNITWSCRLACSRRRASGREPWHSTLP